MQDFSSELTGVVSDQRSMQVPKPIPRSHPRTALRLPRCDTQTRHEGKDRWLDALATGIDTINPEQDVRDLAVGVMDLRIFRVLPLKPCISSRQCGEVR